MKINYLTRTDTNVGAGEFDSIAWLFSEHIGEPDTKEFNFAVIHGNEDSPNKIELWCAEPNFDTPADYVWREPITCPQCELLSINGVTCHETGCPNAGARYDSESGEWIKQRKCFTCGCTVDADDLCCDGEQEEN